MPTPNEKLAASLAALQELRNSGRNVFRSAELSRTHRERLSRNGFLQEVAKGWLVAAHPGVRDGDSTVWYASFWEFCAQYCGDRFEDEWWLSPEQSLLLHAENTVVPSQLVVCSPRGTNNELKLLFDTSLYDLKQPLLPGAGLMTMRDGLRLYSVAACLVKVSESYFARHPIETQVALASVLDPSELLRRLLDGGHSVIAGRLAGALRRIGRPDAADEIVATMKAADYHVRESDPYASEQAVASWRATTAPIIGRLQVMWDSMRETVATTFPEAPGLPRDRDAYMRNVDEIYQIDAYLSLSIEGYRVTPELIERVRSGGWDPDRLEEDRRNRDALAARGYWQAFRQVRASVADIIAGANPGAVVRAAHRDWYRELFQPCVAAGLIPAAALAGYRNDAVYLRNSRYVPPRWEAVRDAMPALFDLLEQEREPGTRAVLGHWLLGCIHPYPDGNGRMARFLMNAMLASGGYPWTVIRVDDRAQYLAALDQASIDMDIRPFATFIAKRVQQSLTEGRKTRRT